VVWFDYVLPALVDGLIEGLEKNIRKRTIVLRHLLEEGLGFRDVPIRIVIVPIHDNIEAQLDGSIDDRADTAHLGGGIREVATVFNPHGDPHKAHVPILLHPTNRITVVVLGSFAPLRPEK
jgi:hypothetical protein